MAKYGSFVRLIRWLLIVIPPSIAFGILLNNGQVIWTYVWSGILTTLTIATPIFSFEIFYLSKPVGAWCRRLPLAGFMAVRVGAWSVLIVIGSLFASTFIWVTPATDILIERDFWWTIGFSFCVAIVVSLSISIGQLLGPGVFSNLIIGRYYRPKTEELAVAFIDLKGSTALAERIGTEKFFEALTEFAALVSEAARSSGGTIYDYVGDEVIVLWSGDKVADLTPAAQSLLALKHKCAASAPQWRKWFGSAADFRASLHVGPVVIGEIGDEKRVIALLGDTMNVAARLEQAARELDEDIVCSAEAARRIEALHGGQTETLPPIMVRGKTGPITITAIRAILS